MRRLLVVWACWELVWLLVMAFEDECYRIFYEERLEWLWEHRWGGR